MKKFSYFISGCVFTFILMTTVLTFAEVSKKVDVILGKVKLVVDGQNAKNETLLYNNTTYLPLREVAEILKKEVYWDAKTNTAYIDENGTNRGSTNVNIKVNIDYFSNVSKDKFKDFYKFDENGDSEVLFWSDDNIKKLSLIEIDNKIQSDNEIKFFKVKELYSIDNFTKDKPLLANITIPETIPNRGISVIDSNNNEKLFYILWDGRDGSISLVAIK